MKLAQRASLAAAFLSVVWLGAAPPAAATSYVMMEDGVLADQAPLIVEGRIEAAARAADAPDSATEYTVKVTRALKGAVHAGTATVRVLGGLPRDDGAWFQVWGAPRFRLGERVLLFLSPRADGSFGLVQLGLGAFRTVADGGRHYALRPEVALHTVAGEERARDYDAFTDWLAARGRGEIRPATYFTAPPGGIGRIAERFQLFEAEGQNFRWFQFDTGKTVDYRANNAGQSGMSGGGFGEVETALWTWNLDDGSSVEFRYRGETGKNTPWTQCDGDNLFLFDDPHGEIDGSFDCTGGGVLAIGGACANSEARFQGKDYWVISEGDVLTQDGAGCVFGGAGGKVGAYIFAHEAGHTLGIGHSCGEGTNNPGCSGAAVNNALMFPSVPGRANQGPRLGDDDRAAAAALYPASGSGGGGGGGGGVDPDGWLTTSEIPGFRFRVEILAPGAAEPIQGVRENLCLAETLCVSGALPGRVEVELRVVGPRPNGKLWPTFVKFTTSRVDIEVEQLATGETRNYTLDEAGPGNDVLNGLFDREGFDP